MNVTTRIFPDREHRMDRPVTEYTMTNDQGISVSVMNYGAIITSVLLPDNQGTPENIVLGFRDMAEYIDHGNLYAGAIVGRTAGRIDGASFRLNGKEYKLPQNDGANNLHGNNEFSTAFWDAEVFDSVDPSVCEHRQKVSVTFFYTSPAGACGFPGKVHAEVTYILDNTNRFTVQMRATVSEATPLDLTNHTYFNLSGNGKRSVERQVLIADADRYLPLREDLIPTGDVLPVDGTRFDFRLGEPLAADYDDPIVFRENDSHALRLSEAASGRSVTITTDAPAFVMYTLNEPAFHTAVALEMQGYPNAVNCPEFPTSIVTPDTPFTRKTTWIFEVH